MAWFARNIMQNLEVPFDVIVVYNHIQTDTNISEANEFICIV